MWKVFAALSSTCTTLHQQHSKTNGRHCPGPRHFPTWQLQLSAMWTLAILIKRLQRVQNAAARVIAKAGRRDHISPIPPKLHWLPVEFRILKDKILLLTYRAIHGGWPRLNLHTYPYTPPRTLRLSTEQLLLVQKYRLKNFGTRSFETAAPALWNSLESQIRLQKNPDLFYKIVENSPVSTSVWWPHVVIDFFLSLFRMFSALNSFQLDTFA